MVAPSTDLIGRSLSCAIVWAASLRLTVYCSEPILTVPAGRIWFCAAIAFCDILRRKTRRLQRLRVEIDLDLAHLAAIGIGNGDAGNGGERRAHEILRQVEHLLLGQRAAREW